MLVLVFAAALLVTAKEWTDAALVLAVAWRQSSCMQSSASTFRALRRIWRGMIVRRLNAIENLGSMDTLCTDKTGAPTEGVVRLNGDDTDHANVRALTAPTAPPHPDVEEPDISRRRLLSPWLLLHPS